MLDKGRIEDLNLLKRAWNLAKTKQERDLLDDVAYKILNEPAYVRSAREALIREKRAGRSENMKQIRSDITKYGEKYKINR